MEILKNLLYIFSVFVVLNVIGSIRSYVIYGECKSWYMWLYDKWKYGNDYDD